MARFARGTTVLALAAVALLTVASCSGTDRAHPPESPSVPPGMASIGGSALTAVANTTAPTSGSPTSSAASTTDPVTVTVGSAVPPAGAAFAKAAAEAYQRWWAQRDALLARPSADVTAVLGKYAALHALRSDESDAESLAEAGQRMTGRNMVLATVTAVKGDDATIGACVDASKTDIVDRSGGPVPQTEQRLRRPDRPRYRTTQIVTRFPDQGGAWLVRESDDADQSC